MKVGVFPVYTEIHERDPEKVYEAVREKNSYLLESSEGGEKVARYSFIGFNPVAKLTVKDRKTNFETKDPALKDLTIEGENPVEVLRKVMHQFRLDVPGLARFFGGFVGYYSYDLVRNFIQLNGSTSDDLKQPDCEFILCKNNVIFDHIEKRTYLLLHRFYQGENIGSDYTLDELRDISEKIKSYEYSADKIEGNGRDYSSNIMKNEYKSNVKKAKNYIRAGDIFQVVLSQRLETDYSGDEFSIYRKLKEINPSPYMYYLDLGDRRIAGSSPEMLVRVENRRVETYPIAGTRRLGRTEKEDSRLEKDLLNDEKEKAEHVMLVDLGRNDIGRVAKYGTVKVSKFMQVEKYSHVQHIISEVVGNLEEDKDEFDAFRSIFPAGTVSGAPKVRAMEIIDELEPTRRGIYAGSIGYFSFNGNMDSAITIRTIEFEKNKAYVQVGAGIVADSKPEKEYMETMNKGRGMLKALGAGK